MATRVNVQERPVAAPPVKHLPLLSRSFAIVVLRFLFEPDAPSVTDRHAAEFFRRIVVGKLIRIGVPKIGSVTMPER